MTASFHAPVLVWFRNDLRLADNPALDAAVRSGRPVMCLFVLDDTAAGSRAPGAASRWWLHHSLAALDARLREKGARLVLASGRAETIVPRLANEAGVSAVYWNRLYEPWATERDARIKAALKAAGRSAESFPGSCLCEPWSVRTKAGGPFSVFTPFWKALSAMGDPAEPLPEPAAIPVPADGPASAALDALSLLPTGPDWAGGLREAWTPGEAGARTRLADWLDGPAAGYDKDRNRPDRPDGTSRLSPHLHFGEISARQIWHATRHRLDGGELDERAGRAFLRELGWRDFNIHLLFHNPTMATENFRRDFDAFPWRRDVEAFRAWSKGRTGYPLVDAGMRELWQTGFMHNRVRMVTASFLVKHLLIDWRAGEAWFRDTLVDADLASNVANWQWVAGCGADAAPYFRIFNPVLQGEKFDPDGVYVRRWIPELADLPDAVLNKPWTASAAQLDRAGVVLGETYPRPVVDHAAARTRALDAYQSIKRKGAA